MYRVEGILGAGGMATVYVARDEKHQRSVAIKVLHPSITDEVFAERFLREIRIAAQFSHPGILGLIDSGSLSIDGAALPYYVMPRVEGETLRERMNREGQLSIDDAVDITRQVADALAYAHSHDVVHRDVKPENIMLTGTHVLVADFGIAKAMTNATMTGLTAEGGMLGTPAYMSPEQVTDTKVGPASDIFSLGVVFYELLTGELPFSGITPQTQLARRLHDTPTPVRKLRPAVSPRLDRVVATMLTRFPKDRFQSGKDVVAALSNQAVMKESRRRSVALAGGAVALLVLVAAFALRQFGGSGTTAQATGPRSIAVLPFANVGTDASNEYYGDGIADELAGSLAKLPGLRVAARSSAFQFKGKNVSARDIARQLGVEAVVEGSVRPMGKQIRITAQLNASDGLGLWSEIYERHVDQVFDVQATITEAIGKALGLGKSTATKATVLNSRAYEAFLQGRWHWGKRNREGFEQAIKYFQLALREDSSYAKAWAGLGDTYSLLAGYGWMAPSLAFEQARMAANRAIALDSTLADAHTALGFVHLFYDRDWNRARDELETAQRLDPKYGEARLFYAWYLLAMNRADDAVDSLRSAVRDEPVSLILNLRLGSILMLGGRTEEAKVQLKHVIELSATYPLAYLDLARIAAVEGDYATATAHLSRAPELVASYGSGIRGVVLARSGRKAEALAEAERLKHGFGPNVSAMGAAQTYGALGDYDRAFEWLERAYEDRDWTLFFARSDPLLVPLHRDTRWAPFIARLNFP